MHSCVSQINTFSIFFLGNVFCGSTSHLSALSSFNRCLQPGIGTPSTLWPVVKILEPPKQTLMGCQGLLSPHLQLEPLGDFCLLPLPVTAWWPLLLARGSINGASSMGGSKPPWDWSSKGPRYIFTTQLGTFVRIASAITLAPESPI